MKKIALLIMITILISIMGLGLFGCVEEEEIDPFEHIYGTYEIRGWSYKTNYSSPFNLAEAK